MDLLDLATTDKPEEKPLMNEEVFSLTSEDGLKLHIYSWLPLSAPDKVIVTVHGLGGHGRFYSNSLAPYFAPTGTAIYAPDLRGHGLSDGSRGDLDSFEHYQRDLAMVVRWVRSKHPGLPLFLLAESMGTSIAINFASLAPSDVMPDGLVLVACVVAPYVTPKVKEVFRTAWYLATDRQKPALPITGREELGIRDHEFIKILKSDELFNRRISIRFLSKMTSHMRQAARRPNALKLPVLLLQGGCDYTVRAKPTRAFFDRIASPDKEMRVFPEAYHALLNDPDSYQVREHLQSWLERQCQKQKGF
jgi:alpha-beta hydrolase superfamily lysophospholipase